MVDNGGKVWYSIYVVSQKIRGDGDIQESV